MKGLFTRNELHRFFNELMHPETFDSKKIAELGVGQKRQLAEYCIKEAERYPKTHSMRYSIMKHMVCAILGIKYKHEDS